jgi:protein-disulfide isomerase
MNRSIVFTTAFFLIGIFAALGWWYNNSGPSSSESKNLIYLEDDLAPSFGNLGAKVVLVEFFDPACGTCAQFAPLVKELIKKHEPNLRLVLRYTPFHENVMPVVYMLEATRAQDKYWESLEAILTYQSSWVSNHVAYPGRVWPILESVGVDVEALKLQMKQPAIKAKIEKDMKDAQALGVQKTPSFYVNGVELKKFGYEPLVQLIESAL